METLETRSAAEAYLEEVHNGSTLLSNFNLEDLFQRVRAGLEAEIVMEESSEQDRKALETQVKMGEDARRRLVRDYQRLLVSIAKRYIGRGPRFVELIHYGTQGLHHYINQGDWKKEIGNPLLVHWWVRKAISEAIANRPAVLNHLVTVQKHLKIELERDPTDEEIVLEMGMLETEDAVNILMSRQREIDLEPTIEEKLQKAVAEVKRLKQLIWPNLTSAT